MLGHHSQSSGIDDDDDAIQFLNKSVCQQQRAYDRQTQIYTLNKNKTKYSKTRL
jgi:hypothetical protein